MKRTDIIVAYATTQRKLFEAAYVELDRYNFDAFTAYTDNTFTVWKAFRSLYQDDYDWSDTLDSIDRIIRCRVAAEHGITVRENILEAHQNKKYRIRF